MAEKTSKEAVLDHSNSMFVVVLRLYRQLLADCQCEDGFIDMMAFDNTHFVVVLAVVLTRCVRSAWG